MSTFLAVDFGAGSGRVIAGRVAGRAVGTGRIASLPQPASTVGRTCVLGLPCLVRGDERGAAPCCGQVCRCGKHRHRHVGCGLRVGGQGRQPDGESLVLPRRFHGRHSGGSVRPYRRSGALRRNRHTGDAHQYDVPALCPEKENEAWLREARHLLFMPDLFAYYLTGIPGNEYCIASTSELLDARRRTMEHAR